MEHFNENIYPRRWPRGNGFPTISCRGVANVVVLLNSRATGLSNSIHWRHIPAYCVSLFAWLSIVSKIPPFCVLMRAECFKEGGSSLEPVKLLEIGNLTLKDDWSSKWKYMLTLKMSQRELKPNTETILNWTRSRFWGHSWHVWCHLDRSILISPRLPSNWLFLTEFHSFYQNYKKVAAVVGSQDRIMSVPDLSSLKWTTPALITDIQAPLAD